MSFDEGAVRVVRADKGSVLVAPDDGLEPLRAVLDRDGLAALDDGRAVPTVGDWVLVDDADGEPHVRQVLPRSSALVRDSAGATSREQVLAANVDVVLVVEHLDPDSDLGRVERLLTLAWRSGARPVVVLTKADLVPDPASMAQDVGAAAIAVEVHAVSAATGAGLEPLRALLTPGATLVVVGPSGAGKSTLVNALAGRDVMSTGERREQDGRGRHTTTHRELVPLPGGAVLIDTPGIRGIGVVADEDALATTFADVAELVALCRFADCHHEGEPGCAVADALATGELSRRRYDSWRKLAREAAYQARRADSRLAAQERNRWKKITQEYQRGMRGPGRPRG
ncbi:ribosome small subunit-dependent GTPase A [Cellulomonas rhizosphaerae]|uniref:Small ribosomal subunit biogenesis GTPase RsgA n=1 Tax=Cellulomonas rhizosphaerae TaxID=2293719 RepID=A0A413RHU8_9CELL|nr:ribosome small subunit-dependent GTPase A [Cellulomonas rhizosphaerae]RHA37782.1 ribosome small subunit-dependent GTPase A [Cellulomonas rhizosphaerae]